MRSNSIVATFSRSVLISAKRSTTSVDSLIMPFLDVWIREVGSPRGYLTSLQGCALGC